MFYAIDFDSRCVESKSDNERLLSKYIKDNKLELAVAIVSNEEELILKLSLNEMQEVYTNLGLKSKLKNESEASICVFNALETSSRKIPTFTKKLGKKLITEASKRYPKNARTKKNKLSKAKDKSQTTPTEKRTRTNRRSKTQLRTIFQRLIK